MNRSFLSLCVILLISYILNAYESKSVSEIPPFPDPEFILDIDNDGINDFISFSRGKASISSHLFKIERIKKVPTNWVFQKGDELWIEKRREALSWKDGKLILRALNIKEQIWARIFRMDKMRANLLAFNLLLTLLLSLLALESVCSFFKKIIFNKNILKTPKQDISLILVRNFFSFVSLVLLLVFLVFFKKKMVYGVWIWVVLASSYLAIPLFFKKKIIEILKGMGIIIFFWVFQYLCYFGFWLPKC